MLPGVLRAHKPSHSGIWDLVGQCLKSTVQEDGHIWRRNASHIVCRLSPMYQAVPGNKHGVYAPFSWRALVYYPAAEHYSRPGVGSMEKERRCPGNAEQKAALHRVSHVRSVQLARGDFCVVAGFVCHVEGHVRQGARQNKALLKMCVSGDDVVVDEACSVVLGWSAGLSRKILRARGSLCWDRSRSKITWRELQERGRAAVVLAVEPFDQYGGASAAGVGTHRHSALHLGRRPLPRHLLDGGEHRLPLQRGHLQRTQHQHACQQEQVTATSEQLLPWQRCPPWSALPVPRSFLPASPACLLAQLAAAAAAAAASKERHLALPAVLPPASTERLS